MIKRLLLVEEDPSTHVLFQEILIDWIVIPAFSAQKAETFLNDEQDFNGVIVMVDLSVVKEAGTEWINKITNTHPGLPIIVLCSDEDGAALKEIKDQEIKDFLIRPFYGEVLVDAVNRAIGL